MARWKFPDYHPIDVKKTQFDQGPPPQSTCSESAPPPNRGRFSEVNGEDHLETRLKAIQGLIGVRENRPKVFSVDFLVEVRNWENYDFPGAFLEGVRRIIRLVPPGSKRGEIAVRLGDHVLTAPRYVNSRIPSQWALDLASDNRPFYKKCGGK